MKQNMTKEEAAKLAVEYKHSGHNCAQAVIRALSEMYGLEGEKLVKASAGFGAGMGTMGATCGSLIGANIIAGVKTEGMRTISKSRELFNEFEKNCGATVCKDLKGIETGKVLCPCDECVRNGVLIAADLL